MLHLNPEAWINNQKSREVVMATLEVGFLHNQLEERKRRLKQAIALAPQKAGLAGLLREVDSALERMAKGTYGICEQCHESIEQDRLLADPLVCYCLDHLSQSQRDALQRDLDLAAQVQRNLLPQPSLRSNGWETAFHYAPVSAVSGDYCDLIQADGQLFFALGDVSGKGVPAAMLMAQLHALFRTLSRLALPLAQMVAQANRIFCETALAGHYATLVCGHAKPTGEVQLHNAGHWPAMVLGHSGTMRVESTGLPLGMFCDADFSATRLHLDPGDLLFLHTDGLTESRRGDDEYGADRITALLRQQFGRRPAEVIAASLEDLRMFMEGPQLDDITIMVIQRAA
jgi:sigma-B regulation protein RsbU (phosphoserine phosphatase)